MPGGRTFMPARELSGPERRRRAAGAGRSPRGADDFVSLGARGTIPENHPHYFHPFDMDGSGLARREADVVLVVGARLGEYDSWGMPPIWGDPAQQKTIQIDADPMSIGLNRPVDLADHRRCPGRPGGAPRSGCARTHAARRNGRPGPISRADRDTMMNGIEFLGQHAAGRRQPRRDGHEGARVLSARRRHRSRRRKHDADRRRVPPDPAARTASSTR